MHLWMRVTQRLGTTVTVVLIAGSGLIGGRLAVDHLEDVVAFTPFVVVAACLIMHLFMHRHSGAHGRDS